MARRCALFLGAALCCANGLAPSGPRPPSVARYAEVGGAWNGTIVVGTHHKTGTVLLAKVFRQAAKQMGVPRAKSNRTLSALCGEMLTHNAPGVCIIEHVSAKDVHERLWQPKQQHSPPTLRSKNEYSPLPPPTPFLHAVRDPVEMCVSAYQYHLQGAEPWLVQPMRDLNGTTLQQHYQRLPPGEGVRFECLRMMLELVETALVYNATRGLSHAMTVRLEDFVRDYDGTFRSIFTFLGSGPYVESLVKAAAPYDLARQKAEDARHVSSTSSKQPLRDMVLRDERLGTLLSDLRELLGYHERANRPAPGPEGLCDQLRALCAATHVGFFQWCSYGRVPRGRIPSLPECGEHGQHDYGATAAGPHEMPRGAKQYEKANVLLGEANVVGRR